MKIIVRNTEAGLIPLYDSDLYEKKKLRLNEDYEVEIKVARNYYFLKKYFALIKCAWLNLPERFDKIYPTPEIFRKTLQIEAGFYDIYLSIEGTKIIEPQSIAFESMDEPQFQELYNKVLDIIIKNFYPGNNREEINNEIINFL